MENIYTRLYVGGDGDYQRLAGKDGWSFLRCCKYGEGGHQQVLGYTTLAAPKGPHYLWVKAKGGDHLLALNILDLDDPNFFDPQMIVTGLRFVKERLDAGDKVLIACNKGHSRGPTMALMFLRWIGEMPYHYVKAETIFRALYPQYDPGIGMRQYSREHWNDLTDGGLID